MKATFSLIVLLSLSGIMIGQITLIPDAAFEQKLISLGIDTDGIVNGQVLTSDIEDETDLGLFDLSITDLTGIEDFASLEDLDIDQMEITEIDLSQNLNLRFLNIQNVDLEGLDISQNVNLVSLLLVLKCESCPFGSTVSSLDLSQNTQLDLFVISSDFITEIDVSNNPNITLFELIRMDDLVNVNLKSGNNQNLDFLRIKDNPNLQCVQVDDPQGVIEGVVPPYDDWIIENNPIITDDCNLGIEDAAIGSINIYPNPVTDILTIDVSNSSITALYVYDSLGKLVLQKGRGFYQLDVSSLPTGLFFLQLETDRGVFTHKIIKE
ncbi:MAG: T9SS type A sorting domain-containing protein [Flavobacteriaceae bacterium]|nr:T9SS type A sorting domain-containing protein [Flavobacteriaceae bacterium]